MSRGTSLPKKVIEFTLKSTVMRTGPVWVKSVTKSVFESVRMLQPKVSVWTWRRWAPGLPPSGTMVAWPLMDHPSGPLSKVTAAPPPAMALAVRASPATVLISAVFISGLSGCLGALELCARFVSGVGPVVNLCDFAPEIRSGRVARVPIRATVFGTLF